MGLEVGDLVAMLKLDDSGFSRSLSNDEGAMRASSLLAEALGKTVGEAGQEMLKAARNSITLAARMEQTRTSFASLLGSAQAGDAFIQKMWDFAAHTPFHAQGLLDAAQQMLALKFDSQDVIPTLTAVGDAESALGGGMDGIQQVTAALGEMNVTGEASNEAMTQLTDSGVDAWDYLADALNTTVASAMDMVQNHAVDSSVAIHAITQGMEQDFSGTMAKQSATLGGMWTTMQDTFDGILAETAQNVLSAFNIKGAMQSALEALTELAQLIDQYGLVGALGRIFTPEDKAIMATIAGAVIGALIPAMYGFAAAAVAATAPLLPFIAIGAAVGALAYTIATQWTTFASAWKLIVSGVADYASGAFEQMSAYVGMAWSEMKQGIWSAISSILDRIAPLARYILGAKSAFDELQRSVTTSMNAAADQVAMYSRRSADATEKMREGGDELSTAAGLIRRAFVDAWSSASSSTTNMADNLDITQARTAALRGAVNQAAASINGTTSALANNTTALGGAASAAMQATGAYSDMANAADKAAQSVKKTTSPLPAATGEASVNNLPINMLNGPLSDVQAHMLEHDAGIPGFALGGLVPGPVDTPRLVVAHAGEQVLTRAQQQGMTTGGHITVNVQLEGETIFRAVRAPMKEYMDLHGITAAL